MTSQNREPNAFDDLNDVTFGSSAIFEIAILGSAGKIETEDVRFQKVLDRRGMKLRDGFVLLIH